MFSETLATIGSLFEGYETFWPLLWLIIAAGVCITLELSSKNSESINPNSSEKKSLSGYSLVLFYVALGGILLAGISLLSYWGEANLPQTVLFGALKVDRLGLLLCGIICIGTALCVITSLETIHKRDVGWGDYLALVLVAASGMMLLVLANDLIMLFLSIELMSLAIYVLVGTKREHATSIEAAMKYLVMGAFASGFLLFGLALLYGISGEIEISAVIEKLGILAQTSTQEGAGSIFPLFLLALGFIMIGLVFKVGAVPFHQWVPDVYTGAPTPITGFMAVAVKTAAFGVLLRFAGIFFPDNVQSSLLSDNTTLLWLIAFATMLLGNWVALTQDNVKRMLAYSSIAHSGYLLMGFVASAGSSQGVGAIVFYLIVYTFGTAGAFAVLNYCEEKGMIGEELQSLRGLSHKHPGAALALALFMFSSAGIPLTGGFIGKYYLFQTTIEAGFYWLALSGVFASMIGAFYYLRVVVFTYIKSPEETETPLGKDENPWALKFVLGASSLAIIALGIFPSGLLQQSSKASLKPSSSSLSLIENDSQKVMTPQNSSLEKSLTQRSQEKRDQSS